MSNPQPSSELTTRDVLQQINHRLSLIETDVRENHAKLEAKIDALEAKTKAEFDAFKGEIEGKINALDHKIEVEIRELRREFNGKFNLVIGLVITSWLSMMATLLFKL